MKTILELTNFMSAYGNLYKAFKNDKEYHVFGINDEVDFQVEMVGITNIKTVTDADLNKIDEIRIWYHSKNTNETIFMAIVVMLLAEYSQKIRLIDVRKTGVKRKFASSVGSFNGDELFSMQLFANNLTNLKYRYCEKIVNYYYRRNELSDSFMMVNGNTIHELSHSDIKQFILEKFIDSTFPSHIIGIVMGHEWEEKGWCFGDNIIYKFVIDLINEGLIKIESSFYEDYDMPPKLAPNNISNGL